MEIDKRTRWWRREDDEKATSGIPDCPRVLPSIDIRARGNGLET